MFFSVASLGPLLYHYENMANELSVELCYEDIKAAMIKFGFHIEVNYALTYISGLTGSVVTIEIALIHISPAGGEGVHPNHLHRE